MGADQSFGSQPEDNKTVQPGRDVNQPTVSLDESSTRKSGQSSGPGGHPEASEFPVHPDYQVTEEIARGGMGRVLAARERALDREVALKTLLPGASAARFVTEAKVTARLPHPGIPPVYALGTLADGSPFLAMKLIRGQTLADELDARPSPAHELPQFLHVFEQVAQAVGFAHAQGIIHRDLKPANIIVGAFGEVQVMDWGLARDEGSAIGTDDVAPTAGSAGDSELTQAGAVMGTPSYMAPEQARGEAVDARADVFALGGILAAILTGQPPFHGTSIRETIDRAAAGDTRDIHDRLEKCQADNELVAIAKSCLQANPAQRPPNGEQLASMVASYREHVAERLRQAEAERAADLAKSAEQHKRRRVVRVSAVALILMLALGVVGTSIGLVQANRAKADAQLQRDAADKASANESEARKVAEKRLEQLQKGNDILASIFQDLDIRGIKARGDELAVVLGERLKNAAATLDEQSLGAPLDVAKLQFVLANSLAGLGHERESLTLAQEAAATTHKLLGPDAYPTIKADILLGQQLGNAGQLSPARRLLEDVTSRSELKLGKTHPTTNKAKVLLAQVLSQLGSGGKAIELLEPIVAGYRDQPPADEFDALEAKNHLSAALQANEQLDEAYNLSKEVYEESLRLYGPKNPFTLTCKMNLATSELENGDAAIAIKSYEETLEQTRQFLGRAHPLTIACLGKLSRALALRGETTRALNLVKDEVKFVQENLGEGHQTSIDCLDNLGNAYFQLARYDEALPLFKQALQISRVEFGDEHPVTITEMNNLAQNLQMLGKVEEANALLEESLLANSKIRGPEAHQTLVLRSNLAANYTALGQPEKAAEQLRELVKIMNNELGADHLNSLIGSANLAHAYSEDKKYSEAVAVLEPLLEQEIATLTREHPLTKATMANLGTAYKGLGRYDEALPLLEEAYAYSPYFPQLSALGDTVLDSYAIAKDKDKAVALAKELFEQDKQRLSERVQVASNGGILAVYLVHATAYAEAEAMLNESLGMFDGVPADDIDRIYFEAALGAAIAGQEGRVEEGETILSTTYARFIENPSKAERPRNHVKILTWLIQTKTKLKKDEEAQKLQAELDELQPPTAGK